MEQLVDIANFLYQEIYDNFGSQGMHCFFSICHSMYPTLDVTLQVLYNV